jgi:MFS family permease
MSAKAQTTSATAGIPWLIVTAGCLIALMTFGPRSAMGFFQLPMLNDTGWDRATFGMAMAIQNLFWGIGQPFFGAIADRFGTWRVLAAAAILYSSGLALMAVADAPWMLHAGGGVLVGLGIAAGSFGVVLSAFARNTPPEKRSLVYGFGTAAGSAGMFVFAPLSQGLINAYGWSDALMIMAAMMLIIPALAIPLYGHRSYVLLTAGFFVCGFQVAFITAHFPAYIADIGIEAKYAVIGLALIGLFNIVGSLASGAMGQHYPKQIMLALIYIGRSIAVTLFLILPQTPTAVIIFAAVMGLLWLSTVPPTNALVAIMFGTRHLGLLGGLVFFSHQIGSFLGIWLGGVFFVRFGSYDPVWWLGVALGIFAAVVHWPIEEKPVVRQPLMPATA